MNIPIGELAQRTGMTVRAIRFYSDRGLVPVAERTPAGYRRYDAEAVARLDLIRTLRELGLNLPTIRQVVDRELALADVAAAHAEALSVQIKTLRFRRAALLAVAQRGSARLLSEVTAFSTDERRRLADEFLDSVFGDHSEHPAFDGIARSLTPELPDDPTAEQVDAWVEWAQLARDPDFRGSLSRLAAQHAADQRGRLRRDVVATVRDMASPVMYAPPASPQAAQVVSMVLADYGDVCGLEPGDELQQRLISRLEAAKDPRRERYLHHLSVINGWTESEPLGPALEWFLEALQATTSATAAAHHAATTAGPG